MSDQKQGDKVHPETSALVYFVRLGIRNEARYKDLVLLKVGCLCVLSNSLLSFVKKFTDV